MAMTWLMAVAMAAPATPQWNTITNSRSRPMFITVERIMAIRGLRLSPTARRMEEVML